MSCNCGCEDNRTVRHGFKLPTEKSYIKNIQKLEKWELVKYIAQSNYFCKEIFNYELPPNLLKKRLAAATRSALHRVGDTCIIKREGIHKNLAEEKTGIILEIYPHGPFEDYLLEIAGEKINSKDLVGEFVGISIDGIW